MKNLKNTPDKIIDFHVHLFPDRLFDAIWNYFSRVYKWDILHHLYARDCIQYLFQEKVQAFVYSNYAHKKGVAHSLNKWNKKILDEYDNIYCFAAFHPDDDNAIDIARDILSYPKVLGIKLQFLVTQFYPHDARLFPLYEMIIEMNKRLLLHVGNGPAGNIFVGADHFELVLNRYPELPANIAHMGGFEYKRFLEMLDSHENLYLDTAFSFLPHKKLKFNLDPSCLIKYQDRILYGSDFPNLIFPRTSEIDSLINLGLSQDFYDNIFYKNGIRLIEENGAKFLL
ncbi:Amidohydrolase 2 [Candidatus Magnetomorum sp. HK-1]|nr:Amidohydrolase 2 [Candidatus Magnetomorum sp. HK-1]